MGSVTMLCWKAVHSNTKRADDSRWRLVMDRMYSCHRMPKYPLSRLSSRGWQASPRYASDVRGHIRKARLLTNLEWRRVRPSDDDGKNQLCRHIDERCTPQALVVGISRLRITLTQGPVALNPPGHSSSGHRDGCGNGSRGVRVILERSVPLR